MPNQSIAYSEPQKLSPHENGNKPNAALNIGVIGLGVGQAHLETYATHADCNVVALCDFDPDKLAEAKTQYPGLKTFTPDADQVLTDPNINVVSIASYDDHHHHQIINALQNDKHVFVEKPLCLHPHHAADIRRHLDAKPALKISSNLILRTSPRFLALKQMIDDGQFGQLYYLDGDYNYGRIHKIIDGWRGKIDDYSPVFGGGVHIIDLMLWLTPATVVEVDAYGSNLATRPSDYRYHDMVVAILKFDTGLLAKMSVNLACVYPHFHKFSVYGAKATFENGPDFATIHDQREAAPTRTITAPYPGVHKGGLIPDFIDAILNDRPPAVSTEQIMRSMSVCFAIEKAARHGGPVPVDYL
jgi:predicted dehydrogenase